MSLSGESHPNSKLTAKAVAEIRASTEPLRILAKQYGVSINRLSVIRRGLGWKEGA